MYLWWVLSRVNLSASSGFGVGMLASRLHVAVGLLAGPFLVALQGQRSNGVLWRHSGTCGNNSWRISAEGSVNGARRTLDRGLHDLFLLLKAAGRRYDNFEASFIVQGAMPGDTLTDFRGGPTFVDRRWLPDSVAKWRVRPYGAHVPM